MSAKSKIIAYQGEPGAYSHLACKNAYPDFEPLSCETFAAAFAAVESREADLALIPIENTLGGRVADMHHLSLSCISLASTIIRLSTVFWVYPMHNSIR